MRADYYKKEIGKKIKKGVYKVGDTIKIVEQLSDSRYYTLVKVEKVIDKGLYNMYLCRNPKSKCIVTITDLDMCCEINYPRKIKM